VKFRIFYLKNVPFLVVRLNRQIIIIIIIIIGATGTISKPLRKYVSNIPGNHEVTNCRKQPYWALHTYFGKC
jgi:hypothetical protein